MHAIVVGIESTQPLSIEGRQGSERERTKQKFLFGNGERCGKHPLRRDNGRATNRLVGSLGKMPKVVVTSLGTKGRNPINLSKYKRDRGNLEQGMNGRRKV